MRNKPQLTTVHNTIVLAIGVGYHACTFNIQVLYVCTPKLLGHFWAFMKVGSMSKIAACMGNIKCPGIRVWLATPLIVLLCNLIMVRHGIPQ